MNLIKHALSVSAAVVPAALARRVAATAAAVAMATSSLIVAQPVAADATYPVNVTFDSVKFTITNDGWADIAGNIDHYLELYGTVGAYTTAGAVSADGLPYRLFGKWGSHPCETTWDSSSGTTCTKEVREGTDYFNNVLLCAGSYYQTCSTGYYKSNNTIPLHVHPGEQFKVTVAMQDYDALSSDDNACTGHLWFGPYTAAELVAKKFVTDAQGKTIQMGYNGNAECFVTFHLS